MELHSQHVMTSNFKLTLCVKKEKIAMSSEKVDTEMLAIIDDDKENQSSDHYSNSGEQVTILSGKTKFPRFSY